MNAGHHFSGKKQSCFLEPLHDVAIIFPIKNKAVSEYAVLGANFSYVRQMKNNLGDIAFSSMISHVNAEDAKKRTQKITEIQLGHITACLR